MLKLGLITICMVLCAAAAYGQATIQSYPDVTLEEAAKDYADVKSVVQDVVTRYPPNEYLYVGTGRSPTPVTAMIKAVLGKDAAVNVPMTGMKHFYPGSQTYTPAYVERFKTHLQHTLPADTVNHGKKLLIIDYADSGGSITNIRREVTDYVKTVSPQKTIEVKALAMVDNKNLEPSLVEKGIDVIHTPEKLGYRLRTHQYGELSEYGRHFVSNRFETGPYKPPRRLSREAKQDEIRNWKKRVLEDPDQSEIAKAMKKEAQEKIDSVRSYDDLVKVFEEESLKDPEFLKFVKTKVPKAAILEASEERLGAARAILAKVGVTGARFETALRILGVVGIVVMAYEMDKHGRASEKEGYGYADGAVDVLADSATFGIVPGYIETNKAVLGGLVKLGEDPSLKGSYLWNATHAGIDTEAGSKRQRLEQWGKTIYGPSYRLPPEQSSTTY